MMSLLPSLRIEFDKALSTAQRAEALEKVRSIQGIISVDDFGQSPVVSVTYMGGQKVIDQVRAIKGLQVDARHRF